MPSSVASDHPMQAVFQTLLRLLHVNTVEMKKDTANAIDPTHSAMQHVIDQAKRLEEYDAKAGLLEGAPLVHALTLHADIPPTWLEVFSTEAHNNGLFDAFNGKTIGDWAFERMFEIPDRFKSYSQTLAWWLKNAPLDPVKSVNWLEVFERAKPSEKSYYGSEKNLDAFVAILQKRGVSRVDDEQGRPQDRWSTRPLVWDKLANDGRLEEMVRCPSGRLVPLLDFLLLGHDKNATYPGSETIGGWAVARNLLPAPQESNGDAPHGRRKELADLYILGANITSAERAVRASQSMQKTPEVIWEIAARVNEPTPRRPAPTEKVRQMLAYRSPSGMSLEGWFKITKGTERSFPSFNGIELESVCSEDGHGLFMQLLRLDASNQKAEFGTSIIAHVTPPKHPSAELLAQWLGDGALHGELVDALVDRIVAPRPNAMAMQCAQSIDEGQWLDDPLLARKLGQALKLVKLKGFMERVVRENGPSSGYTTYHRTQWQEECKNALQDLLDDVNGRSWEIGLSSRDWQSLAATWSYTPGSWALLQPAVGMLAAQVDAALHVATTALVLGEASEQSAARAVSKRHSRL